MIEKEAMFSLTYGLFVLTTTDGQKQNGCIINTVSMLTDSPKRITVFINNDNYSCELLKRTKLFTVSVLTENTPFAIFQQFGFVSGREKDKFEGGRYATSENGLYYLPEVSNAFISGKVVDFYDYGTHTLFVAEVTEAKALGQDKSLSYAHYLQNIKPDSVKTVAKADSVPEKKTHRYVCEVCGYEYEGENLPVDFICPWCKHPASDFKQID